MTSLGKGEKAAQAAALGAAKAALKGLGGNEITSGATRKRTTATAKAAHAHSAGIYVKKLKVRRIRLRGSRPSNY